MIKSKKPLIILLSIFLIYIIILLVKKTYFFWDATIYLSMSKYFASLGKIGFYELIRPPFFPFSIALLSLLGIEKSIAGHLIVILSCLASIILVYNISNDLFGKKGAVITTFLFSISSTFVFYGSRILNGNVSMFLVLLTIYLFIKKKNIFVVGLVAGLSAITRFPNMVVMVALGLYILLQNFDKKDLKKTLILTFKKCLILTLGFLTTLLPYLTFNYIKFGSPILPFQEASNTIHIVSQTVNEGLFYYPLHILIESIFLIFFLVGIFYIIKQKPKKHYIILLLITALSFFTYYSTVGHKEMRYLLVIFPYLFILSFYGLEKLTENKKHTSLKRALIIILTIFCIMQSVSLTTSYYRNFAVPFDNEIGEGFFNSNLQGLSVVSGPQVLTYQDIEVIIIYSIEENLFDYYESFSPDNYLINTCDLYCPEKDLDCPANKVEFISTLKENYNIIFHKNTTYCDYYLFS